MAKRSYPAALEPADGGYGVSFPDLPGLVSFGADLDDAVLQAEEGLSLHLEGMAEDGEPFPQPTPLRDLIVTFPAVLEGKIWAIVSAEAPDAAERVNVYLSKSLLERIDRFAKASGINRSGFFGLAARRYMGEGGEGLDQHQAAAIRAELGLAPAQPGAGSTRHG